MHCAIMSMQNPSRSSTQDHKRWLLDLYLTARWPSHEFRREPSRFESEFPLLTQESTRIEGTQHPPMAFRQHNSRGKWDGRQLTTTLEGFHARRFHDKAFHPFLLYPCLITQGMLYDILHDDEYERIDGYLCSQYGSLWHDVTRARRVRIALPS